MRAVAGVLPAALAMLAAAPAHSTDAGIESISITSSPGADKTYGKNGAFGTNDTITVRVDFTNRLGTVITGNLHLDIRIGANTRRASNPTFNGADSNLWDKLDFSYAVQESDWDGDGISFPANPMGGGKTGSLRFHTSGLGGGDNRVNRDFGAIPNDPGHKVRGRQTTPTFGSTASPAYSWVRSNAVSQQLPAATQGDGGVTYSVKEALPDGLAFAAATRTLSGAPTTAQAAANYTLVATDGDGDKAELRFSIEIQGLSFSISSPSVTEGAAGETAALDYEVSLNRAPGRQVTVDYAAAADPGTASSGTDYTAFAGDTLTFAAAETSKTVTVTATGDALDEPNETIRIALSNPSGATLGSASTGVGTITDDDPTPVLSLALSEPDGGRAGAIAESGAGNAATVTARLRGGTSGEAITVTVAATSVYAALAADGGFALSADRTLTIAANATASAGVVTITAVDDAIDSTDKSATVSGRVAGGHGLVLAPSSLTLSITDDDAQPTSALVLTPASISETGGVATVTATLSNPSAAAVTLTTAAAPGTGAAVGDYTLSSANTLTVAAGATVSSGQVTVTANPNAVDSADKGVTVSATASGSPGAADPPDATLAIRDDDGAPTVSLVLSSSSVSENGGAATVTAALSGTSSQAVTVTVSAAAVSSSGAAVGDYTLTGTTLTIAANATASAGTVTITANDNAVDSPDKRVTVTGAATGGNGVADPASLTLTLADDEATPTARLALSRASIAEAGGVSSVTATLSGASSAAVTVTVSAAPGTNAAADDYTLSSANTLTIAAGNTASAGAVTVTAEPDTADSADKRVTVSGQAAGGNGIADPAAATLTILDDDALPTVTLALSSATIVESGAGNVATVTAALSHPSGEAVEVAVSVSPTPPAAASDFGLSANRTLTIAAGDMASVGVVEITAVDNGADAPDKTATISGAAAGGRGVADPRSLTLTVADDDDAPGVTLAVSPASISENGGEATVTATLSPASNAATTITVTAVSGFYTVGSDAAIVIAAGQTANAADTALITAVDNDVYEGGGGRATTVTAGMANDRGASAVTGATLTLTDDETQPTLTLVLSPASVSETGGVSTVTARLSGASSAPATVTVTATAGTNAVPGDFTQTGTKLTIAAGATTSAGAVTVTGRGDDTDSPDKSVTVAGVVVGGNGLTGLADTTLTLEDDDAPPMVTLRLSRASLDEGGADSAAVTAALSHPSSEAVIVTVSASPVAPAVAGDFGLSATRTLTFAAGQTASAGVVTITAGDNDVDGPDGRVRVSGATTGGRGAADPAAATLTIVDDEATPTVTLALSPASISEGGGVATVTATLSGKSGAAATVTVAAAPGTGAAAADYALSANKALTIAAGATASAGVVTITAVNNDVAANKTVTVTGAAAGGHGVADPASVTLTITDNESGTPTGNDRRWGQGHNYDVTTASLLGKTAPQTIAVTAPPAEDASRRQVWACAYRTVSQRSPGPAPTEGATCRLAAGGGWSRTIRLTQAMIDNDGVVVLVTDTIRGGQGGNQTNFFYAEWVPIVALPKATLSLSSAAIWENAGVSTVTATLDKAAVSAATLTVSVSPAPPALAGDAALSASAALTFAAGATASAGAVTITGVDNAVDAPDRRVTVRASASDDVRAPPAATLTLRDDDDPPTPVLTASPASISESGGVATVTAALSHPSSAATTVTVSAAAGAHAAAADFTQTGATLTIPAGRTESTGVVTVTAVGNAADSPDKRVEVSGTAGNRRGVSAVTEATFAITDDDTTPTAALAVMPASIAETGGVATVTATLSHRSSEPVTITVSASPGSGTDFTLSAANTLTIAAGATASAGAVTITANDDDADSPDKRVEVSGAASGGLGVADPAPVTLAIRDDDGAPQASLALSSSSISENGGTATLTVALSSAAAADVRVLITVTPNANVAGYRAVGVGGQTGTGLTIAAGRTASTEAVVFTGLDDDVDAPNRELRIEGRVPSGSGVPAHGAKDAFLVLVDDEPTPSVSLALSSSSISETGGEATVTATLSGESSEAVTVTVSAVPGAGAAARDFTLSAARTLTIAAGSTASVGLATVTAVGNAAVTPDKRVQVRGAVAGGNGAAKPNPVTLILEDDDARPTASLVLSSSSISETGGKATVTAALSYPAREAVTITVSATEVAPATSGDFTLSSPATLTIAAGNTTSAGLVTVTAVGNDDDAADKKVTVSGAAAGGGVADPADAALTLLDDDGPPTLALVLSPASVPEAGGVSTVTAALSGAASAAVTVTVTAAPGTGAAARDFTLSSPATLTVAAGSTASAGVVTVTANDNAADSPGGTVTVSGAASGGGAADPADAALALLDDDDPPGVALSASPASISEAGGVTTVSAALSHPSSAVTTVTVASLSGAYAVDPSTAQIVIQAGRTENPADTATLTAVDDAIDEPDRQVTVAGAAANDQGAGGVTGAVLAITDDEETPTVTLTLAPASVAENGGVSTVSATLSGASSEAVTVTVTPVAGAYAQGADAVIVIAAGSTATTDKATVEAVDNADYEGAAGRSVTVTGAASSGLGANPVTGAALTLTDDDDPPAVTLAVNPASVAEAGGAATVSATLAHASVEAVTVTVTPVAGAYTTGSDAEIVIAAGQTAGGDDTATVAAVDNDVHEGGAGRSVTVTGRAASGPGAGAVTGAALMLTDDDALPTLTLALEPASISESGGAATVTAALSHPSGAAVTVTVAAAPGTGAAAADFDLSAAKTLTIAAGSTTSAGAVTVTANGNDVDSPDKAVTVSGAAVGGNGVAAPSDVTLTLTDDEILPTVTLALSSSSIGENGGVASVTAALSGASSEAVTVTVAAAPGSYAAARDFTLSAARTLTVAAGGTASAGAVTVTANNNGLDSPNKQVTISGAVTGGNGAADAADATLTINDDDRTPTVTLFSPTDAGWEGHSGAARRPGGFTYTQAGQLNFVLQMDGASELPITFTLGASGAATAGLDYTSLVGRVVTVPPGRTSLSFHVTVLDDDIDESLYESVNLRLANPVNANVRDWTANTQIRDDDDAAGLTVVESQGSTRTGEAGTTDSFTVALSSEPTAAVTVAASIPSGSSGEGELSVDGGGTWGSSGTLSFSATNWSVAQEVRVRGVDDDADDGDASYAVTLNPDSAADANYRGLGNVTVSVTNLDDDAAGLTVVESQGSTRTSERETTDSFTVALSSAPTAAVTVAVESGNASEGLVSVAGGSTAATAALTFDATTWSTAQTVTVHGQNDGPANPVDGDVSYVITLDPDSAAATATPPGDAGYRDLASSEVRAANLDDDGARVSLHLSSARIAEDGGQAGAATVTARLPLPLPTAMTVTVTAAPVAPAVAGDFTLSAATTLTLKMGQTASEGVVTVAAVNDQVDGPDKQVTISASAASDANTQAVLPLTLTIADDDATPEVTLTVAPASISEVGGVASVSATLSRASSAATTVTVTPKPGAWTVGPDATIAIAAGATAAASDMARLVAVDNLRDDDARQETVTATVANDHSSPAGAGGVTGATLTLTDNDNQPDLALTDAASVSEGDAGDAMPGTLTFTARLGVVSGKQVTVDYADAGAGTATSGTDYTALASGTLTFAPGDRSKDVVVTVTGDAGHEADETVILTLSNATNATLSGATGTGLIVDDDTRPTLAIGAARVTEGDAGQATLSFPVTLSIASGQTVTVSYAEGSGGTATAGVDYTALAPGALTFAPGETAGTIAVTVAGDALDEVDETVVVTLSDAVNAALGTATATGAIADDDPSPTLSISSPSVTEGDTGQAALSFAVTLDAVSGRRVTVAWADAGAGTATSGTDYAALAGGTLTFAPGQTRKTIAAAVEGDTLDEAHETLRLTLSNPSGATLGSASTGIGAIRDDDPTPSLAIDSPEVGEGGTLTFTVTLSAASGRQVTAAYAEGTGGTATAGADYTALAPGTLTFAAGETAKTIGVAAWSDTRSEADETVVVVLSGPVNATLGMATGTGTIADDSQPSFAVSQVARTLGINRTFPTFSLPAATGGNGALTYAMATLPAGLRYTAPGAQDTHGGRITGRPTQTRGATVYRLTATDRDGDVATLNVSIAVSVNPGVEELRITNDRGAALANFRTGDFILFAFYFDAAIATPSAGIGLKFKIGDNDREAEAATFYDTNPGELTFQYQVQASDWDGDGITIPRHPFRLFFDANAGVTGYIVADGGPYHNTPAILDLDVRAPISFTNRPPRINDRAPSFGSATVAAKSFVKGSRVWADDPALPAASFPTPGAGETATDVNSSLTYSLTPALPAGLAFDAAARRITGAPTAAAAAATYRLTATDVDGDRATLTFSLTVEEDARPAFAADAPAGYAWTEDAAVSELLPAASGGNPPLSYALSGPGSAATLSLPPGLEFDLDGTGTCGAARTVCGTPTAAAGAAAWTLTATDRDGDPGSLAFTMTIAPRAPDRVTGVTTTPAVDALRVDWTAAAKADGYKVQWRSGSESYDPATRQAAVTGGATTAYTITGLAAGADTVVRVISTRTGAPDGPASLEAAGRPTDVSLALSRTTIEEDAGAAADARAAAVTARLAAALSEATTVTVSARAGTNAAADDFTQTGTTLTIAAGATASTGTVTIAAVDDEVDSIVDSSVAGKQVTVSGVSSGNGNPAALTLTVTEDDAAGLALAPALPADANDPWFTLAEGGTATFTVALASEPTANATVEVSSGDDSEGLLSSGGSAPAAATTLTFTPGNWMTAQTVTLTGATDGAVDGAVDYRLTLDPDGASSDAYDKLASTVAKARTTDVDAAGLVVSQGAVTVAEDETETFTLALASKPAADVTVTIASGNPAELRVGKIRGGWADAQTLTFTPGNWMTAQTVGVLARDDRVDEDDEQTAFTLDAASTGDADYDGLADVIVTVTTTDDDPSPSVAIGQARVSEGGAALSFPVTLAFIPGLMGVTASEREATVDYADAGAGTATSGADYTALAAGALTFAAGETSKTIDVAVTDDALDEASETVVVELTGAAGLTLSSTAATATGTIDDDDPAPVVSIAGASASEGDDPAALSFAVTLDAASGRQTTVDYAEGTGGTATAGTDYTALAAGALTFAAGATAGTIDVAVTQDVADEPDETVVVALTGAAALTLSSTAATATGTIADDDDPPTLSISSPGVAEDVGTLSFTVTPDVVSGKQVTVGYADAGTGTAASGVDYTAIAAGTLTLAPGAASGSIEVAVTDDALNEADETIVVSLSGAVDASVAPGTASGAATIADNDAITAQLAVSPASISEDGGVTTVTATMTPRSTDAVTITVAPDADFTLAGATLTIAAGATASTGVVTATANDNAADAPDNSVTVTGQASGGNGAVTVAGATLTVTDDDGAPQAVLTATPSTIDEAGGVATVTASLSHPSSAATTVTVIVNLGKDTHNDDYTLTGAKLTIAAGATASTGRVTLTAVENTDTEDKLVVLTGAAANDQGVTIISNDQDADAPTVRIRDNDGPAVATLMLSATSIAEAGGRATVTASLSKAVTTAVTVHVTVANSVSPEDKDGFKLSTNSSLTIAAGATASTGSVWVAGVADNVDAADRVLSVSGAVAASSGVENPLSVTLTIVDDDATPEVTLAVAPGSVSEAGGAATVTATLSHPSGAATTVTVTPVAGGYAVGDATIVIAAGGTSNKDDEATVTATDDDVHQGSAGRSVTVTASVANAVGADDEVTGASLTLNDDDAAPQATLALTPTTVSEAGGAATVTAALSRPSTLAATLTVAAAAGTNAQARDFTLSAARTLTFAAGRTASAGRVTVTAVDDDQDGPAKQVTLTATAAGPAGMPDAPAVTLSLADDDAAPTARLVLSRSSISEAGGVATVTAALSHPSSSATTVTVQAAAGTNAAPGDFTLSAARTLTIVAGGTASAGQVTVAANDNDVHGAAKEVTVSGSMTNDHSFPGGTGAVAAATLTIADDEAAPTVTLALQPATIAEAGGVATVTATLSGASPAATTITLTPLAGAYGVGSDAVIVIAAGATANASDTATVTAVDNDAHEGGAGRNVTVTASVANDVAAGNVAGAALTLTDDDSLPTVALAVSPLSIAESGGQATVTASLSHPSGEAVTVTVTSAPGAGAASGDFTQTGATLTIAAGATASSGAVTITANDNGRDEPDGNVSVAVTVSGAAAGGNGVADPADVELAIVDDDGAPQVALALSSASVTEGGGAATVTASLSPAASAAVTVRVTVAAVPPAAAADLSLSASTSLVFAAGATASAGVVTVAAADDALDEADEAATVSGAASGGGALDPPALTLAVLDDDDPPTVAIAAASVAEGAAGATATLSLPVTLDAASGKRVTVEYAEDTGGTATAGTDYTALASGSLTFAAGETSRTVDVTVTGDAADEPDETVKVILSAPVNATLGTAAATGTITDDEAKPTATLALSSASITENGGVSTVTAALSHPSSEAVTLTVSAAPVAASGAAAADFDLSAANTLTIAAGSTASAGAVTVAAVDNPADAPDRRVRVSARAAGGLGVAAPPTRS